MDTKKLKTSQLLDGIGDEKDDALFGAMLDEVYERIPFADMWERFEEIEKRNKELEEENESLRRTLKAHAHLDGKVVIKA